MTAEQFVPPAPRPERIAYTAEEAAQLIGCAPSAVLMARKRGRLVGTRAGKRWVFTRAALERWIDSTAADIRARPAGRGRIRPVP